MVRAWLVYCEEEIIGYGQVLSGVDLSIRAPASRLIVIIAWHFSVTPGGGEDDDGDKGTMSSTGVMEMLYRSRSPLHGSIFVLLNRHEPETRTYTSCKRMMIIEARARVTVRARASRDF